MANGDWIGRLRIIEICAASHEAQIVCAFNTLEQVAEMQESYIKAIIWSNVNYDP